VVGEFNRLREVGFGILYKILPFIAINNINAMAQHNFVKTYFSSPTWCSYCKEFIWGVTKKQGTHLFFDHSLIINSGYKCSACGGVAHSKCRTTAGSCSKSPVPINVKPDPPAPTNGGGAAATGTGPKPAARYAQAMFDFPPESEHELELKVGDKIEVLQQEGEWWFGVLGDGRRGYFPYNYVEKIGTW
jgi:hypothetical protein